MNSTLKIEQVSSDSSVLIIKHPLCEAKVSLHGGHVLSWIPKGQQDVFWVSDSAVYGGQTAIRGGIPICWPWFGERDGDRNHGFARNVSWQFDEFTVTEEGVEVVISLTGCGDLPTWKFDYQLSQRLFFGRHFVQTFTVKNTSTEPWSYCGALHSYFNVSSAQDTLIPQLIGVPFDDKINQLENCIEEQPLTGAGPVDRVYHSNETMTIIDQQWRRMLTIESPDFQQRVFWNPGKEVASVMADIHQNGEQNFVCFEVANTEYRQLAAGDSHTLQQVITLA